MSTAIRCSHLTFRYKDSRVLTDVSFEIMQNEYIGIIGPNGGGKTTLLKLILGFLKPESGELSIFEDSPLEIRQKLAYVPQNMRFDRFFPITALEVVLQGRLTHLTWWGTFRNEDKEIAIESLKQVGLGHIGSKPFGTLSGGQQQRVLIARALASRPFILLLDEPTASVDAEAEKEILSVIKSLESRMTILMVTHDLPTAVHLVDRVLVCAQGNVYSYSPQEICEHYALGLYHPPLLQLPQRKFP
jgi:zinc transport system ATP-binding protein